MRKSTPAWIATGGLVVGAALLLGRIGLASSPNLFGTGRNPTLALTVTADGGADGGRVQSVNSYAALTQTAASGTTTLVVDNAAPFTAGSTAMVWQTTGLTSPGLDAGWQADGGLLAEAGTPLNFDITNNQVGNYEWVLISSTNVTTNTITLSQPITSAYGGYAAGDSQVITVPAFTTVTVNPGAVLAPGQPWDGAKGGIVVFTAQTVINNGTILADGYGFRGGISRNNYAGVQNPTANNHNYFTGCTAMNGWVSGVGNGGPDAGGAHKGENLVDKSWFNELADGGTTFTNEAGSPADPTYFSYGRGNIANGGGGGNCTNSGGGGGGHGGQGGNGGISFSGDGSRAVGGIGGSAFTYSTVDHLAFGGGGGAGDENDYDGTAGGNGGGVVFIQAGTIAGSGIFSANGSAPPVAVAPYSAIVGSNVATNDGAGGGGAGGVVVLKATSTACGLAAANGGAGGNTTGADPGNNYQGGAGGQGRVDIQPLVPGDAGGCAVQINPGAPGVAAGYGSYAFGGSPDAGTPAANLILSTAPNGAVFDASACTPAQIAAGYCDGCSSNADCTVTPTTPVCNPTTAICVTCIHDTDCTSPTAPFCNDGNNTGAAVTFQCVGCLTNTQCQLDGGVNVCQASTNTCVSPTNVGDGGTSVPLDAGSDSGGGTGGSDAGSTGDGGDVVVPSVKPGCGCGVGNSSSSGAVPAGFVMALASLAALLRIRRPRRISK